MFVHFILYELSIILFLKWRFFLHNIILVFGENFEKLQRNFLNTMFIVLLDINHEKIDENF